MTQRGGGTTSAQEVECSECTFILTHWQFRSKQPPCRLEDRTGTKFEACPYIHVCDTGQLMQQLHGLA